MYRESPEHTELLLDARSRQPKPILIESPGLNSLARIWELTLLVWSVLWQDPMMEVRSMFGEKVKRTVLLLNARPGYSQRASKYAAMLPLAGMDPSECNRQAASPLTLVPVSIDDNE